MRWPFTGREAELRLVGDALATGESGGVVIAGPAGVGKTRLTTEAAELAAARGCAVEWVRASGSARSIPFGAFAPMLPATPLPAGVELLARARHALAERAGDRRLVLCVDDGHLLDDASAALVHQLVAAGEAFAVVSLRRGDPPPDALRALWKDELCALLDLTELSRDEVEQLLAAALGAPLDGRSVNALWELTRGNALFLRELVRHGLDHGQLTEDGGVWRWRGEIKAGTRLTDFMDVRVEDAGPALELIAVADPLEVGLLEPDELAALEELERGELVERRSDGRRRFAAVAHPLHGEAVRARLTRTRVETIHARLADAVEACGARRGSDLLRVAVWRLEAGVTGDADLFARAAERALSVSDVDLGARLAHMAVQAGGGFRARLMLARGLAGRGRAGEAQQILEALGSETTDDAERAAVATASARNLFWGLERADEADGVLERAEAQVADRALRDGLRAQRVRLTAAAGLPQAALAAAEPLLRDPAIDEATRITVALGATEALMTAGRSDEAAALAEASLPAARRVRDTLPQAETVLTGMRDVALRLSGRLVDATAVSEQAYAVLLGLRSTVGTAVEAVSLGMIWLARGRVQTALRFCREGAALMRDGDSVGMLAFALAAVAQAAAQAGDGDAAADALAEMDRTPLGHKGWAVEIHLARAWTAAATGESSTARAQARAAAEYADERGQHAYTVRALHDLCRLGDAATSAPQLTGLAARVDGPFAAVAAAHAQAQVADDGAALLDAAERFAALDALLVAAEVADAAARAHRRAGRDDSARRAAARSAVWLEQCEGARPPTLLAAPEAAELTPREREIALLAAAGSSSRQIAGRLVISVRTVDNHLQNAYRKLGVSRREDLPRVLSR
jgi:ATP/maltotriose-dependent transcriptional regulator MalT